MLIVLFQVGGLGILTFSTIFFVLLGRGLASKEQDIMQSAFLYAPAPGPGVRPQVRDSFDPDVRRRGHRLSSGCGSAGISRRRRRSYIAVFHAVSAFNNCGFSLFSDNLVSYQGDLIVNLGR